MIDIDDRTLKRATLVFIVLSAISLNTAFAAASLSKGPDQPDIKVEIESMKYEGGDTYSLVIATANSSSTSALVSIIEEGFFIQTDRGWTQLTVLNGTDHKEETFHVMPSGKKDRPAKFNIPLTTPDLFRTYEGDLSLMYKYSYSVQSANGSRGASRKADEVYCWVKPETSRWILREGM